jgi:hypothetical protein
MLGIVPCVGPYYDKHLHPKALPYTTQKKHAHTHTHTMLMPINIPTTITKSFFSHTHDMHVRSMKLKTHNGMERKKERKLG